MSFDRDAALDQLAEWEEEERMEEWNGQQMEEDHEQYLQYLADEEAAKPQYQKEDEYYATETELDEKAEQDYMKQLQKYYDGLEFQQMIESEEKNMGLIVEDYYEECDKEKKD